MKRKFFSNGILPFATSGLTHLAGGFVLFAAALQSPPRLEITAGTTSIEYAAPRSMESIESANAMEIATNESEAIDIPDTQESNRLRPQPTEMPSKRRRLDRATEWEFEELPTRPSQPSLTRRTPEWEATEPAHELAMLRPRKVPVPPSASSSPVVPALDEAGTAWEPDIKPLPTNAPPRYPAVALQQRLQGRVVLRITVAAKGNVIAVAIESTSGHDILDRAAMEAVVQWRFEPWDAPWGTTSTVVRAPIVFNLADRNTPL